MEECPYFLQYCDSISFLSRIYNDIKSEPYQIIDGKTNICKFTIGDDDKLLEKFYTNFKGCYLDNISKLEKDKIYSFLETIKNKWNKLTSDEKTSLNNIPIYTDKYNKYNISNENCNTIKNLLDITIPIMSEDEKLLEKFFLNFKGCYNISKLEKDKIYSLLETIKNKWNKLTSDEKTSLNNIPIYTDKYNISNENCNTIKNLLDITIPL